MESRPKERAEMVHRSSRFKHACGLRYSLHFHLERAEENAPGWEIKRPRFNIICAEGGSDGGAVSISSRFFLGARLQGYGASARDANVLPPRESVEELIPCEGWSNFFLGICRHQFRKACDAPDQFLGISGALFTDLPPPLVCASGELPRRRGFMSTGRRPVVNRCR